MIRIGFMDEDRRAELRGASRDSSQRVIAARGRRNGRINATQAPPPALFATSRRPPCASTISAVTLRPMPIPPSFWEKKSSRWRASASAEKPGPVSLKSSRASAPSAAIEIVSTPLRFIAWIALRMMFVIACKSRRASAKTRCSDVARFAISTPACSAVARRLRTARSTSSSSPDDRRLRRRRPREKHPLIHESLDACRFIEKDRHRLAQGRLRLVR